VRAVYTESYAMFTRGGVYRVVKEALGGTLAKLSVSALLFDYILTGPLSGVSAGQYIVGLLAQTLPPLVTGGTGRKRRSTYGPQISPCSLPGISDGAIRAASTRPLAMY
jgi:amino acid transporter